MFIQHLNGQTYDKDWERFVKILESGKDLTIKETEAFIIKHQKKLAENPDNSTQLYSLLANAYSKLPDSEKALELYLTSLAYAQKSQDSTLKFIVAYSIGVLNYNHQNLLEAEKYYYYCMAGMAAIYGQSSREYTGIFNEYTNLLVDLGKYSEAKSYVEGLLYYYKTLDGENNQTYLKLLTSKAIIAQNLGDYATAKALFSEMVIKESILKLGDSLGQVIQTSNLSDIYRETGDYKSAIHYSQLAKELYIKYNLDITHNKPHEREVLATIENNLGLTYKAMSNPRKSEEAYNKAISIYTLLGRTNTEAYCTTLSNIANLYSELGRYGEASEILWLAIETRKKYFGNTNESYANAISNLAIVFMYSEHYEQALEKNLEALEIYKTTVGESHQSYANSLNNLSLNYVKLKDYKKAEEYKLRALQIIENTVGKNHYRYAAYLISTYDLYTETDEAQKAVKNLKEARQLIAKNFGKNHELYARAGFALADIYTTQKKYKDAGPLFIESLDYYADQVDNYFDAMSEENQAEFLANLIPFFQSYNIFLINYKTDHSTDNMDIYLERAVKYQLQLKSLLANRSAQVRNQILNSKDEELISIYREWVDVKNELINTFKSTEPVTDNNALYKRSSDLEVSLKSKLGKFENKKELSLTSIRQNLAPNEAAIEIFRVYARVEDTLESIKYGALIIRKNTPTPAFIIFKNGEELDKKYFDSYSTCMDGQITDSTSYITYFKPFEPYLKTIKKIYLSSDGIFHKISFLGLYDIKHKKYLADVYDIYQTSNLGSIGATNTIPGKGNLSASLFGYPDYDYDFKKNKTTISINSDQLVATRFGLTELAKLPGTKKEVESIDKTLKIRNWTSTVFMDEFASEENLRKVNNPRILHIATHGFYLKDIENDDKLFLGFENSAIKKNSMLRSGLILAGAGPATQDSTNRNSENDGILTAEEASLLNLNKTDLVVLSACQTGLGDEMGTEGVAGLQRSFNIAGAKNILMSLWPVDDDATSLLMIEFYKNYAITQNADTSFKTAQAEVRKKYPHPYYWAAFVLLKTFN